ncbi:MAG: chemotaxis protein CheW [Leptolyngbyaceae cyanobacterium MAG.088]|nr:chemotaxis protein CheW [Leptolyngbyaceae cyanobacterium MAG.088]
MADAQQFCTFFLNRLFFGVTVEKVQEIIRYHEMTHVPLAPSEVGGLINLRGQIVTAIDLRQRLAMPKRPNTQAPLNVVVQVGEDTISLLVDAVGDVLDVDPKYFELPPETLTGQIRTLIQGTYKLDDQLLLVLDVDKVADITAN